MTAIIALPQALETSVTGSLGGCFSYRYGYARSSTTRADNATGEDYVAFSDQGSRIAFALCDGVSQSFFGDLAARWLGESLVDWLLSIDLSGELDEIVLQERLDALLIELKTRCQPYVQGFQMPDSLASMLPAVLEKKRGKGSQSMFAAGLLDHDAQKLVLARIGNVRLRLSRANGDDKRSPFAEILRPKDGWSTQQGRVGQDQMLVAPIEDISHILVYSDGFAQLDTIATKGWANSQWQGLLDGPLGDDVSFFEIYLGPERPPFTASFLLPAPQHLAAQIEDGLLVAHWEPIKAANSYHVEIESDVRETVIGKTIEPKWTSKFHNDVAPVRLRVQTVSDSGLGLWSPWVDPLAEAKQRAPAITDTTGTLTRPSAAEDAVQGLPPTTFIPVAKQSELAPLNSSISPLHPSQPAPNLVPTVMVSVFAMAAGILLGWLVFYGNSPLNQMVRVLYGMASSTAVVATATPVEQSTSPSPVATSFPLLVPTATPQHKRPTVIPRRTRTPQPTATSQPTETAQPTETSQPTATSQPATALHPTETPHPTSTAPSQPSTPTQPTSQASSSPYNLREFTQVFTSTASPAVPQAQKLR